MSGSSLALSDKRFLTININVVKLYRTFARYNAFLGESHPSKQQCNLHLF